MKSSLTIIFFLICLSGWTQKKYNVAEIAISGNKKTKPRIITRELSFRSGLSYTKSELDSMFVWDRNRIYNTNLFNTVELTIEDIDETNLRVKITVEERWYLYPIPIFDLVDRNFNDWWVNRNGDLSRVNIGLRLIKFNFRGRAERLQLTFQTGLTDIYLVRYRIPYIEKTQKHGLEFIAGYVETKNLAHNTKDNLPSFLSGEKILNRRYNFNISHTYRSSFYSFHNTIVRFRSGNIADTIAALNPNYYGNRASNQRYASLGYYYIWEKRNNVNYATSGEYVRAGVEKFGLGIYDDVDFWLFRASAAKYNQISKNFYHHIYGSAVASVPGDRQYNTYLQIGIEQQVLRGYDLYIIEGSRFFILRNDLKYKLFSVQKNISKIMPLKQFSTFPLTVFAKVFLDQGFAKGYPNYEGSKLLADRYLYSYGVGVDLKIIYDAVIRFEYSRNTLGETNFFFNFGTLF